MLSQYVDEPCLYCRLRTVRPALDGDWAVGEKAARDYNPNGAKYMICDSCQKKQILMV